MSTFDPYREWLGIESNRKPTYYQLIGVSPSEEDATVIRQSALRRLEELSRIEDPARQQIKQKLVQRVKRAAKCLMNEELRVHYDRQLLARNEVDDVVLLAQDSTSIEGQRESAAGAETEETLALNTESSAKPSVARKYKSKQRKSHALFLYGLLGLISLGGICFLVATQTPWGESIFGLSKVALTRETPPVPFDEGAEPLPMEEPNRPLPGEAANSDDPSTTVDTYVLKESDDDPREPTLQEVRQLEDALKSARAALENRETTRAQMILDGVSQINKWPGHRAMYARLVSLTYFVSEYWKSLDDALDRLQAGAELVIGEDRMMVVEVNPQTLVLRSQGKNRTLSRNDLPFELEVALADKWFNTSAASSKVFRGAMMAVSADFGDEAVRKLWRQAKFEGADIEDLELVLDDNYDLTDTSVFIDSTQTTSTDQGPIHDSP